MYLSSNILPKNKQKCQINGPSTWIRVSRDWFTPIQVEYRFPPASGWFVTDSPPFRWNIGFHPHRGQRPDLFTGHQPTCQNQVYFSKYPGRLRSSLIETIGVSKYPRVLGEIYLALALRLGPYKG